MGYWVAALLLEVFVGPYVFLLARLVPLAGGHGGVAAPTAPPRGLSVGGAVAAVAAGSPEPL